jgi:hypothetical protein
MGYSLNQKKVVAPTAQHGYWGRFTTSATLPNAAASTVQDPMVDYGDLAWSDADGKMYVCADPTLSAATWTALAASGEAGTVGPSNTIYVDGVVGNNATGTRGNAARPYQTIQAAINAAQSGDVVQLAPQSFAIAAPITIPATIERISIASEPLSDILYGTTGARLIGAVNTDVLDLGSVAGILARCDLSGLYIETSGTGIGIKAHGDLYAQDAFLYEGLSLLNVCAYAAGAAGYAASLKYTGAVDVTGGYLQGSKRFESCGQTTMRSVALTITGGSACEIDYDPTDPLASSAGPGFDLLDGTQGIHITLEGTARVFCDPGSGIVGNLTANGLTGTGPYVQWWGYLSTIDFGSVAAKELPDTASAMVLDFSGAHITGAAAQFKVAGAAANAQSVVLDGATGGTVAVTAGAAINLRAKGHSINAPTWATVGTGTVNPGRVNYTIGPLAAGATACPLGFTSPVTTYAAQASADTLAAAPLACTDYATTTFNVRSTAGGGNARVTVTWP